MPAGWVCFFQQNPAVVWGSTSDQTDALPGLVCQQLDHGQLGTGDRAFSWWWKIARTIEGFPP